MKKTALALAVASFVTLPALAYNAEQKPATEHTKQFQTELRGTLPFADKKDWELAEKGFIAREENLEIKNADGKVVWELGNYKYLTLGKDWDSIHPSMQRQAELNLKHGLFKVRDGVYQVRGYDLAQITFIRTQTGWVVIDPLTIPETAKAAHELFKKHVKDGNLPIKAVIYSHSHGDHFGGVKGVINQADVDAGKVQVIAPRRFSDFSISENVLAGNAMSRRVQFQYGNTLAKSELGQVDAAIGKGVANGGLSLILPTHEVNVDEETLTLDGVDFVFQNADDTEAPSEMNTYIPSIKTYWGAETTVAGLHNIYTLRGAFTRDALAWADSINKALYSFGGEAETLIASHGWPRWGNAEIRNYLEKQRDMYGYLHDETLRLMNHGVSINDMQDEFWVPPTLANEWYLRGYHGSYHRNAKAVVNKYIGYFDMDPATLLPLSKVDAGKHYVEAFGVDAIMAAGKKAYDEGNYRWCAEIVNKAVMADANNMDARYLAADCFEQLGYQSESSGERNTFLAGALELRQGVVKATAVKSVTPDVVAAMRVTDFLNFMGVRLNGPKAAADNFEFSATLRMPDIKQVYAMDLKNGRLSNIEGFEAKNPTFTLELNRADFTRLLTKQVTLQELLKDGKAKATGEIEAFGKLTAYLDDFDAYFPMALPVDHSGYSHGKSKTGQSPINR
ncbi:alkyl/aryl-sulfatase [Atopomonas sediminilitoris]|uniref:alkyl/aryl-sulfatase n=1 Tax=Atopomonas sediminilitoris TaxID=2919919 RepID=UPI001F4E0EFC|nr:alkyl sulfatase dimerization domain-containing protein [Atopomonas sediminilitoris]MCJ8168133.1 MBL fold metallo-hydrolase [Atopomonas sediminilitoris]